MIENEDFISKLSDDILSMILSKLRVDEGVRCDTLARRWKGLWKKTSHMEFQGKHMIMPYSQLHYSRRSLTASQICSLKRHLQQRILWYGANIYHCLSNHSNGISSCRIMHYRESLVNGDLNAWLYFLTHSINGFLKDLILECIPDNVEKAETYYLGTNFFHTSMWLPEICQPLPRGIFYCLDSLELTNYTIDSPSPFENCCKLKTLKLKRIKMDQSTLTGILGNCVVLENFSLFESFGFMSLIISKSELKVLQLESIFASELRVIAENLEVLVFSSINFSAEENIFIYAPNLQKFQCDEFTLFSRILPIKKFVLEKKEIPLHSPDLLGLQPKATIFKNMVSLDIHLNLRIALNHIGLYLVLKSCQHLKHIKINSEVTGASWAHNENDLLPYDSDLFWQRIEVSDSECMNHGLKSLSIKGFTGKGYEVEFVKCLVTNARDMERITLWFVDDCSWIEAIETQILLSYPKASTKLFIDLKPGKIYMRNVGGSFQMWVRTLGQPSVEG